MVIPVYILPVMAVIFFTAGGVTARKRKTELEIPDKRKKISCILFLLFLVFTVLSIVILQIEGQFYGEPVKILSTALDKNDVMVLYDQPADTKNLSLAKDDTFLTDAQSTERIRYKDVLYNTNTIKRKDVFGNKKRRCRAEQYFYFTMYSKGKSIMLLESFRMLSDNCFGRLRKKVK